jgi:peptidyl-prolyl cis-trans isomerase A (cyclophilin A)
MKLPMAERPTMTSLTSTSRLRDSSALFCLVALTATLAAGCGGGGGDAGAPAPQTVACTASPPPAPPSPSTLDPQVTLTFKNGLGVDGTVVLTLNRTQAPLTVANFLQYVNSGFYNCTIIHRFSPGFVVQGGAYAAPVSVGAATAPTAKTTGAPITLEDNAGLSNTRMTIAMARASAPDSATSQYFINLVNNSASLDRAGSTRGYAVFGSVTSGSGVVDAMTTAPCTFWSALVFAGECVHNPNVVLMSAAQTR